MKLMTSELAAEITASFSILKFFPRVEEARLEIADLLRDMCPSAEAGIWLRERVLAKWSEWEGPGPLRELLSERFKPADQPRAVHEYDPFVIPRYREIIDADGNVLGVKLLGGANPRMLPAAGTDVEVASECVALVKHVTGSHLTPRANRFDVAPVPADKNCPRCHGSGWLIPDEMRCDCTWRPRPKPIHVPDTPELRDEFSSSRLAFEVAIAGRAFETKADRELKSAMTPQRSEAEKDALVNALKAEMARRDYRPPEGLGPQREIPVGSEKFLVQ
jgi:hypothetical protein